MRPPPPARAALSGALVMAVLTACGVVPGAQPEPAPPSTSTPTATVGPTPSAASPSTYEVLIRDLALEDPSRDRSLPTTLWYPAAGDGPFPLVVFSHGLLSEPSAYRDLLTAWASAGLVVAAPAFPLTRRGTAGDSDDIDNQPADISFVLDRVLALGSAVGDDLAGRLDPANIAAAGHSAGAITTLGLLNTCCADDRVTAAVLLAGMSRNFPDDAERPGVPTLFVHGSTDDVVPLAEGRAAFDSATGPKAFLELVNGSHSSPYDLRTDLLSATVRATTSHFLRWALTGDPKALDALRMDADQPGFARLTDDRLGD